MVNWVIKCRNVESATAALSATSLTSTPNQQIVCPVRCAHLHVGSMHVWLSVNSILIHCQHHNAISHSPLCTSPFNLIAIEVPILMATRPATRRVCSLWILETGMLSCWCWGIHNPFDVPFMNDLFNHRYSGNQKCFMYLCVAESMRQTSIVYAFCRDTLYRIDSWFIDGLASAKRVALEFLTLPTKCPANLHSKFCKRILPACTECRECDLHFVAAQCQYRTDTVDERMHMEFNCYIVDAHALGGRRKQWICIICIVRPQSTRHAEIHRLSVFCDYSDAEPVMHNASELLALVVAHDLIAFN